MQNKLLFICLGAIFLILAPKVSAQIPNDIDVDQLKEQLKQQLKDQIPNDLLPVDMNNITLPDPNEIKKVLREKCETVTGSDAAYEEAEQATTTLIECLTPLVNFEELQDEIKVAKPTGDLDTVFNKYCRKRSTAIECINTFSNVAEQCLLEEEKQSKNVAVNIFTNLLNFVCHKDGDQIALFIAEKGPECFTAQKDEIISCMNKTYGGYFKDKDDKLPKLDDIPKLVIGKRECEDMDSLQYCVVRVLEDCEETTPANLVESMFKFVKSETPCANFTSTRAEARDSRTNTGDVSKASLKVLLGTWTMVLMAKFMIY